MKLHDLPGFGALGHAFNRTELELKQDLAGNEVWESATFNRTELELKQAFTIPYRSAQCLQSHRIGIETVKQGTETKPCLTFNRTELELKQDDKIRGRGVWLAFNRTELELKPLATAKTWPMFAGLQSHRIGIETQQQAD